MKEIKIHFICSGNTFRSRMAEAYLNSKTMNLRATSSGIEAGEIPQPPLSVYAQPILNRLGILNLTQEKPTKTYLKLLQEADWVIFMAEHHFHYCQSLGYEGQNFEIWQVLDLTERGLVGKVDEEILHQNAEEIFEEIRKKIEGLIERLS